MSTPTNVVIIGGGFAGLELAKQLGGDQRFQVTLVDRRNFHLFTPMLYQVAVAALSPAEIAAPLRHILRKYRNVQTIKGEVTAIDPERKLVQLRDGELPYDALIVATGNQKHYFGHDEWQADAPGLESIEDALTVRRRVLTAFEAAEREADPERRKALLTFVIVGGGPTGVELAGSIAELAHYGLRGEFRTIDAAEATIILLEGSDRVLQTFHPDQAPRVLRALSDRVQVRTNTRVIAIDSTGVTVHTAAGTEERISAHTVLWGAGVKGSPLGAQLAEQVGAEVDRAGRVKVQPDLSLPGHPELFIAGDLAHVHDEATDAALPGVAQVALQQGRYLAKLLKARARGNAVPAFRYHDPGRMAVIGRNAAVYELGGLRFGGFPAWLFWLAIHIFYLIGFANQLVVLVQWAYAYFTFRQRVRIITGEDWAAPLVTPPAALGGWHHRGTEAG